MYRLIGSDETASKTRKCLTQHTAINQLTSIALIHLSYISYTYGSTLAQAHGCINAHGSDLEWAHCKPERKLKAHL